MKYKRDTERRRFDLGWIAGAALLLLLGTGAIAQDAADLEITLGAGFAGREDTVEIDVSLTSNGDSPTSLLLFITYDPEALVAHPQYFETNTLGEDGMPDINADGNTETLSGPVCLDKALWRSGKVADATIYPEGVVGILIAGMDGTIIPDGPLCQVAFEVLPGVQVGGVTAIGGAPSDAPIALDGEMASSAGAIGTEEALTVSFADGSVRFLQCSTAPPAPLAPAVSQDRPDGVRVHWDAVDEDDVEYRVYRSTSGFLYDAIPLGEGWHSSTTFVDITAAAAEDIPSTGCFLVSDIVTTPYYYWVKARTASGCQSGFSGRSGAGFRNIISNVRAFDSTSQEVFPGRAAAGGPEILVGSMSPLAIRLTASSDIDPATVTGEVLGNTVNSTAVEWKPVLSENASTFRSKTGWVVFHPTTPWVLDDIITMTVRANMVPNIFGQVYEVTPVTRQFTLAPDNATEGVTTGDATLIAVGLDELPVLNEGLGTVYRIDPRGVYDEPQQIWIPKPSDRSLWDLELYYFDNAEGAGRWFVASNVKDWLLSGPEEQAFGGTSYLGYTIRHGGYVQLGLRPGQTGTAASVWAADSAGAWICLGLVMLILAAKARRKAAKA